MQNRDQRHNFTPQSVQSNLLQLKSDLNCQTFKFLLNVCGNARMNPRPIQIHRQLFVICILSVLKEHNVLPASYFQNLHFIIFGYPVYYGVLEYLILFEFSFLIVNQMIPGTSFLFSHFFFSQTSRFTCPTSSWL